jgi:antitoxin HigA-1
MNGIAAAALPAFEPPHPGVMIRDLLNEEGVSARQAATQIGVSPPALNNVLLCRSAISPDMALRLSRLFGNSPQFWTRLQEQHDLWHRERALAPELAKIERLAFAEG